MSLEDTPEPEMSDLDKGDRVVTVSPDKGYTIIPDELYIFNHNQKSVSFYVEVRAADVRMVGGRLTGSKQAIIVNLIPYSRYDDLAPSEV